MGWKMGKMGTGRHGGGALVADAVGNNLGGGGGASFGATCIRTGRPVRGECAACRRKCPDRQKQSAKRRGRRPKTLTGPDAQERWLRENTFACERLHARITPAACKAYRAENSGKQTRERVGVYFMPGPCTGCKQYKTATAGVKLAAPKRGGKC